MKWPALVVFDMAGTTVRDNGEVPAAFTAALAQAGLHATPEELNAVRGTSKREAVMRFVPDGVDRERTGAEVYATFCEALAHRYETDGVQEIAGASDAFRSLRERGVRVALNTGFDREITSLLLRALRWNDGIVDAVVCGDDVKQGRPAPYLIFRAMEMTGTLSVHDVMNVGDTSSDLEAGNNAGVRWNVGVLSGAHDRKRLEGVPHTHLIESVAEVMNLLSRHPEPRRRRRIWVRAKS